MRRSRVFQWLLVGGALWLVYELVSAEFKATHPVDESDQPMTASPGMTAASERNPEWPDSYPEYWRRRNDPSAEYDYHGFDPAYWRIFIRPSRASSSWYWPSGDCPFLKHPTAEAIPLFRALLRDESSRTRGATLICIWKLADQAVPLVPDVARAMINGDTRIPAHLVLRSLGPAAHEAVPTLAEALKSEDRETRYFAASALAAIDAQPHADRVIPILREAIIKKSRVNYSVAEAIDDLAHYPFSDQRVSDLLVDVLLNAEEFDSYWAMAAARAIGKCGRGSPQAAAALRSALATAAPDVRVPAACALYKLTADDKTVLPILLDFCRTRPNDYRYESDLIDSLVGLAKHRTEAVDGLVVLCDPRQADSFMKENRFLWWLNRKAPDVAATVKKRIDAPASTK